MLHRQTCSNLSDTIDVRVFVTHRHLDQVTKTPTLIISQKFEHVCRCSRCMHRDLLSKTVVAESGIFLMFPDLNPFSCHKTVERRHGRE